MNVYSMSNFRIQTVYYWQAEYAHLKVFFQTLDNCVILKINVKSWQ